VETDLLTQLIDKKHGVLVQLHQTSQRQLSLARDGGDVARLLSLLAAKQTLLGELTKIEKCLDPFRAQDPERRVWRSPLDRQRCAQTADRSGSLLAEIMSMEKQGETELVRRRDAAAEQLQAAATAAQARQAYSTSAPVPDHQLDLTSD